MIQEKINKIYSRPKRYFFTGAFFAIGILATYFGFSNFSTIRYDGKNNEDNLSGVKKIEEYRPTHIKTPNAVKAIYMTACVASTQSLRDNLINLIDTTEINSLVLNVKEETGKIVFDVDDPALKNSVADLSSGECKISDIKELIELLHSKNIYVIGRIPVFQDQYLTKIRPDLAVKKASDGSVWKDRKGVKWLDTGSKEVWDYAVAIGKQAYKYGFDELNFDYIRFPSDGNMKDIYYPFSEKKIETDPVSGKANILKDFFAYLDNSFAETEAVLSADLFGMVTTNTDDLNIGQVLENALPYFDYIAPMVYPSHYPPGFNGWKNPNNYPYELIKFVMGKGVERAKVASSTPAKLRPWLQDFDYGGDYDVAEVRAQIKATYDVGLNSWMLWSASNKYTRGALNVE